MVAVRLATHDVYVIMTFQIITVVLYIVKTAGTIV